MGRVESVNVGRPRVVEIEGRQVRTSIVKTPVADRQPVRDAHVGEDQPVEDAHGGVHKAAYAYAVEDYDWWAEQLQRELEPGTFGENLTVADVDVTGARIGERWRVGTAVVRVTEPRIPCFKLGWRMGDPRFPARFGRAGRPGAYLAIEQPGEVGAGDAVEVLDRPGHEVSVGDVARAYHGGRDPSFAARLADVPELSPQWRAWARSLLAS